MNYKEELDKELNEYRKSRYEFANNENKVKNEYADFIQEAIPRFIEQQNKNIESQNQNIEEQNKKKNESKIKQFFKRLLKIL